MHPYSWLPHNFPFPHMPSLKAETHNQIGTKRTIPPEFACYITNVLMLKWEYKLRRKLLTRCRSDSNCADLMETMSHQDIPWCAFQAAFLEPKKGNVHGTLSYTITALPSKHTCSSAGYFCRVFNSDCWRVFQPIQWPRFERKMHWTSTLLCGYFLC